ncbi:MAG: Crp/Fnr family transcriptional regulator, partial [Geminicoccaceae bacterium]|nr:Crp/Fnr family transcriptional regulator [Geminicoccaceae bacterium]
ATDAASRNRLLAALEPDDLRHLAPHLERVELARGTVLLEPHAEFQHVWWPEDCIISLVIPTSEGGAEAATIGREGMIGFIAALGVPPRALARDVVQVPGRALRLPLTALQEAFAASPSIHQVCLCYVAALVAHVLQSVACNALHTVEARLARWLLLFQDRVDGIGALPITQELLAEMLGVQRTTVTAAARALQQAGLIAYKWGSVTVLDRAGLERVSCECYGVIREHYEQVSSCIRG